MKRTLFLILSGFLIIFQSCTDDKTFTENRSKFENPYNVILHENYYHTSDLSYQSDADIYLWMLTEGRIANWLGRYDFELYEPVNVMWIDYSAESISEARHNVSVFLDSCGFLTRGLSSSGYYTVIDDFRIAQYPDELTWSDDPNPLAENNHGRIFASRELESNSGSPVYYTTGAFSRESAVSHNFISFDTARDQINISGNWKEETDFITGNVYNSCSSIEECRENNYPFSTIDHSGIRIFVLYPLGLN